MTGSLRTGMERDKQALVQKIGISLDVHEFQGTSFERV